MRELLTFVRAELADLAKVNALIAAAVGGWPTSARLSRLAAVSLSYGALDFEDFEMVLCYKAAAEIGVAVWQPNALIRLHNGDRAAWLHGLYVAPSAQGQGIGRELLKEIARRASSRHRYTLYVRAERFAEGFFERLGGRRLSSQEGPEGGAQAYPHRFVMAVENVARN
jgi:GNAT superfamily N-acetyltransferase